MIAAWMLYCVGIGVAFVIVGHALERGLHLAGRPTRWAWAAALAGSLLVPTAAWLRPDAFRTVSVPVPERVVPEPIVGIASDVAENAVVAAPVALRALEPGDLDGPLAWSWGLASVALLAALTIAAVRLAALRRGWRATVVDGRRVFVSNDVGPAVAGVWDPRIVIPGWALQLTEPQRKLMLAHEEEHVMAGDPRLLACGALALLLAPWNPALWWQMRRLRLAVEMDCDARVLARGGPAPAYGELLLQVGGRRTRLALTAALGEPRSFLERRIRRMATSLPRWRWFGAAVAIVVAGGAIAVACEAPRPVAPTVQARIDSAMPTLQARIDSAMAEHLRPWIRENLDRSYPDLLREQSGPPVDVWFGHDARWQVLRSARTAGTAKRIGSDDIRSVFREFRPGNDGWSIVDRRTLKGLVRDNVRVVWVHLGRHADDRHGVSDPMRPGGLSSRQAAELVRQHFPQLLRGRDEPVYLWLVFDAAGRLVGKGAAPRAPTDRSLSTEMGRLLIPGYDTLLTHQVREYGVLGYGTLAPNSPPVMWVRLGDRRVRDHSTFDEHPEMVTLPWIREGITRHYPTLVSERSGPPVELWFVADSRKQILRTMRRPGHDSIRVGIKEIQAAFPALDESSVNEWSVFQGHRLGGLVRDNVFVIWIQLREGKSIPAR